MTTLVLHIGSPKTGSTSIQRAIRSRAHYLFSSNWVVLPPNPFRRLEPSGCIATLYCHGDDLPAVWARRCTDNPRKYERDVTRYESCIRSLVRPRLRDRPPFVFLSSEYLWGFSTENIARLRSDFLSLGVENFVVIAYVRHPVRFFASSLQQHAKVRSDFARFNPVKWKYNFKRRLEAWLHVFGSSVLTRIYDPNSFPNGNIVHDVSAVLQAVLGSAPPTRDFSKSIRLNQSLSVEEILALQALMARCPESSAGVSLARRDRLSSCIRILRQKVSSEALSTTALSVRADIQALIFQSHRADIEWLMRTCSLDLSGSYSLSTDSHRLSFLSDLNKNICLEDFLDVAPDAHSLGILNELLSSHVLPP
jgi:hypothetical protein